MTTEATRERAFLRRLVGRWDLIADATGSNPEHGVWRETVRSIEDVWFVCEGHGDMPGGGNATTLLTLGCATESGQPEPGQPGSGRPEPGRPGAGRFVGSWIDSVMPHMWVYDGALDDAGRDLVLYTSGPDMENPCRTAQYREVMTFQGDDIRSFTSHIRTPEGQWRVLMVRHYRRCR